MISMGIGKLFWKINIVWRFETWKQSTSQTNNKSTQETEIVRLMPTYNLVAIAELDKHNYVCKSNNLK